MTGEAWSQGSRQKSEKQPSLSHPKARGSPRDPAAVEGVQARRTEAIAMAASCFHRYGVI